MKKTTNMTPAELRERVRSMVRNAKSTVEVDEAIKMITAWKPTTGRSTRKEPGTEVRGGLYREVLWLCCGDDSWKMSDWAKVFVMDILLTNDTYNINSIPRRLFFNVAD